jgi:hypothetical protein
MMARDVVALSQMVWAEDGKNPFKNRKVELAAVALAETGGTLAVGAYHDNYSGNLTPQLVSRDCGLMQINIPASMIGSPTESELRTEDAHDPDEAHRIALNNLTAAADLFNEPWTHGTKRQWQPWVAYTEGWALYPEAWVWSRVLDDTWVATGRYLHKAIRGVANYHWKSGNLPLNGALAEAERLAEFYGVTKGMLYVHGVDGVIWRYPEKPSEPGSDADYPVKNDGRSVILPG